MKSCSTDINYRKLNSNDISILNTFIHEQLNNIRDDFFYSPKPKIIEQALNSLTGCSLGAFNCNHLIGIRLTYFPGLDIENHGYELDYDNQKLLKVAQFHGTIVKANARFNGVGQELVKMNCEDVSLTGKKIILATVHPENHYSINMLKKNALKTEKQLSNITMFLA